MSEQPTVEQTPTAAQGLEQARVEGAKARRAGKSLTDCPFDPNASTWAEQSKVRYWVQGWNRINNALKRR